MHSCILVSNLAKQTSLFPLSSKGRLHHFTGDPIRLTGRENPRINYNYNLPSAGRFIFYFSRVSDMQYVPTFKPGEQTVQCVSLCPAPLSVPLSAQDRAGTDPAYRLSLPSAHVHTRVCSRTRTHARTHARTHTRTHARTHAYTRTHARTHAHTHTHTHHVKQGGRSPLTVSLFVPCPQFHWP